MKDFSFLFGTEAYDKFSEYYQHPSKSSLPRTARLPKPLVSPYGAGYSMHPELSRPGIGYIARLVYTNPAFYIPALTLALTTQTHLGHRVLVESLPENQRQSFWQAIAQGMTGGFGVGSATSKYV